MATPRQMTAHTLDAKKGWPNMAAVDFRAKLSANVTIDPFYAGRCVYLNASGEYETGCPAGATSKVNMPIWIFQNSDDPDVANDGGITGSSSDDPGGWIAIAPVGYIMGLVGAGAYELETTEFEPESTLGTSYAPGDCLQAVNANTTALTGGRMTKGTRYTDMIVGTVSRAVTQNAHGKNVLAFWPYVLPPTA